MAFTLGGVMDQMREAALEAIQAAGGGAALSRKLGLVRQAVYQWDRVPPHHVIRVEAITGIPRQRLRPDLYPAEAITAVQ